MAYLLLLLKNQQFATPLKALGMLMEGSPLSLAA
jgi:hypothetical protein